MSFFRPAVRRMKMLKQEEGIAMHYFREQMRTLALLEPHSNHNFCFENGGYWRHFAKLVSERYRLTKA